MIIGIAKWDFHLAKRHALFTILTVGDGIVSQIPALLISTATGIVVTRAASEGNLGSDITNQLFGQPKLLYVAGWNDFVTWTLYTNSLIY